MTTKAEEVTAFDGDLKKFVKNMHETMDDAKGIGLAANQVGVLQRVLVIYIPWDGERYPDEEKEPKKEKVTKTKSNKNTNETGYFEVSIDGKTFKSTNFANDYCNMQFTYNGDKSASTIRFKDKETGNSMVINIYGSESYIDKPDARIPNIRPKVNDTPSVMIAYIENGQYSQSHLGEGEVLIEEFSKGKIVGSFKGKGGALKDILTGETMVPYEGKFSLTTDLVQEVRI